MSEWIEHSLQEVAASSPNAIVDGPFGSNLKTSDYVEHGVPVLQGNNISHDRFEWHDVRYITHSKAQELIRSAVRVGDLLVVKIGSVGYSAVIDTLQGNDFAIIPTNLLKATFHPDKVLAKYVYYNLTSEKGKRVLKDIAGNTAQPALSLKSFKAIKFHFPALNEQKGIVAILSAIDDANKQTKALIAKMQQIKTGLMHDLFTRGIMPNGQLRPLREAAPQLYKESPLGWIPKEWQSQRCVDICSVITVGIVLRPTQYYVSEGIPAFRSANVREIGIDPTDLVYISPESNNRLLKSQLREGDVISVRTGYPGTSTTVPAEYEGVNCIDLLISRPLPFVRSVYLAAWINSPFGKEQVLRKQGGLAQQHFNVSELRQLRLALPDVDEQDRIIGRLSIIDCKIHQETVLAEKYKLMKSGLMNDLLTGRVRVPESMLKKAAITT